MTGAIFLASTIYGCCEMWNLTRLQTVVRILSVVLIHAFYPPRKTVMPTELATMCEVIKALDPKINLEKTKTS